MHFFNHVDTAKNPPLPPSNNVGMKKTRLGQGKVYSPAQTTTLFGRWRKRGEITADIVNRPLSNCVGTKDEPEGTNLHFFFWTNKGKCQFVPSASSLFFCSNNIRKLPIVLRVLSPIVAQKRMQLRDIFYPF